MDKLLQMYGACESSPAYIHLPQDKETFIALRDLLQEAAPGEFLKLEALVNAHSAAAAQEGFVNGWAWAQATARECLALRELPVLAADYGPAQRCGNCKWFVQRYRYTGSYPWYALVGCGHCIDPERDKRKRMQRNPVWRGCTHWRPGG